MADRNSVADQRSAPKGAKARELMLGYLDKVASHLGYVRVGNADELEQARAMLASDLGERVLHELQLAYLRRRQQFAAVDSPADLQRLLESLLARAARKVAQDEEAARTFAEVCEGESADEAEFADGALRAAADRWRDA